MLLLERNRRSDLAAPAWHYLDGVGDATLREILGGLLDVFERFKDSVTDANGFVWVGKSEGLLGGLVEREHRGTKYFGSLKQVQASEVEPWECAGPYVFDELALFDELLFMAYPPLHDLMRRYGTEVCLSVALASNVERALVESLIDASARLTRLISASARTWEKLAHEAAREIDNNSKAKKQAWKVLQHKGVQAKKELADNGTCKRLAVNYKRDHPFAKKPEIVDYVFHRIREPDYRLDLTPTYIAKIIAGYEGQAALMTNQSGR